MPRKKVEPGPSVSVTGACSLSGRWENFVVTVDQVPVDALNDNERLQFLLSSAFLEHLRKFVIIPRHFQVRKEDENV